MGRENHLGEEGQDADEKKVDDNEETHDDLREGR